LEGDVTEVEEGILSLKPIGEDTDSAALSVSAERSTIADEGSVGGNREVEDSFAPNSAAFSGSIASAGDIFEEI
jgi:hypothetical protein